MCIGVFSFEHPDYALVLCTNRDEFLDRPTRNAHFHSFGDGEESIPDGSGQVLSGRDLQAGGSWFGLNRSGRVALLTNITEPLQKYNTSRGYLVSSFLLSSSRHPLEDEIGKIIPPDAKFAGFNLLLLAPTLDAQGQLEYDARFVTNHGGGGALTSRALLPSERACGGISNGIDGAGANLWPKVQHATEAFKAGAHALSRSATESDLTEHLFNLLAWHPPESIVHRSELRNTVHVNPIPYHLDGSPDAAPAYYGTRLATVLLVSKTGDVVFIERDMWVVGEGGKPAKAHPSTERVFRFKLELDS